jgi:hypothetical protein
VRRKQRRPRDDLGNGRDEGFLGRTVEVAGTQLQTRRVFLSANRRRLRRNLG